jgi:5-methylcytosine-specific restriction protein A
VYVSRVEQMPRFLKSGGDPYLEVHHVIQLADNGSDQTSNAVAVCPNCHRALHLADNKDQLIEDLYRRVSRLER